MAQTRRYKVSGARFKGKSLSGDSVLHFVYLYRDEETKQDFVIYTTRVLTQTPRDYLDTYKEIRKVKFNGKLYSYIENEDMFLLDSLFMAAFVARDLFVQMNKEEQMPCIH